MVGNKQRMLKNPPQDLFSAVEECAEVASSRGQESEVARSHMLPGGDQALPGVTRATDQSYVRKRKKIDFTVRDLESGADDDSGSDQEWTLKSCFTQEWTMDR